MRAVSPAGRRALAGRCNGGADAPSIGPRRTSGNGRASRRRCRARGNGSKITCPAAPARIWLPILLLNLSIKQRGTFVSVRARPRSTCRNGRSRTLCHSYPCFPILSPSLPATGDLPRSDRSRPPASRLLRTRRVARQPHTSSPTPPGRTLRSPTAGQGWTWRST
jgi:hypothetical protein